MRKVRVEQAVGLPLGHDITRITAGRKYRAFKRGHIIAAQDIPLLLEIGKEHIYVWEDDAGMVHEDDAANRLAAAAAGTGVRITAPSQGRVNLEAIHPGLLKVENSRLKRLNSLDNIILAALHNNSVVQENQTVAGTRVVPVAVEAELLEEGLNLAGTPAPLVMVKPFLPLWVAVVTTGSEINSGRIKDGFSGVIRKKINPFGGRWMGQTIVPDEPEVIAQEIQNFVAEGAQLVLVTGGMSVDADDTTPRAIQATGAHTVFYGAPVLPGSQFMLAYQGRVPICGVPGGAMFSRITTLDLLLPRIFAGERISRNDIAALGNGGLCLECKPCHFPKCPFGKSTSDA